MSRKPQIFYDSTCPVCSNYIRMIKRKIPPEQMEYLPSGEDAKDFKYVNAKGQSFMGEVAIDNLAADFPAILEFMWMLPKSLKVPGLKAAYKTGSIIRRTITKKKGCNCGK